MTNTIYLSTVIRVDYNQLTDSIGNMSGGAIWRLYRDHVMDTTQSLNREHVCGATWKLYKEDVQGTSWRLYREYVWGATWRLYKGHVQDTTWRLYMNMSWVSHGAV